MLLQQQQLLGFQVCDSMTDFDWLGRNAKVVVFILVAVSLLRGGTEKNHPELRS
jgi:hypothetical protein